MDTGGSAPLSERVRDALLAAFAEGWADPARLSSESRRASALLEGARAAIADAVGARPEHVHFTPSIHLGFERLLSGMVKARRTKTPVAVSAIERDALTHAAEHASPSPLLTVPVDHHGHVDAAALKDAVTSGASLVAIQHANQELGTVQDLDALGEFVTRAGIPLVVDASSSLGHLDPPSTWDALVGHPADWGGPAGIGVIAVRPHTRWLPTWPEGDDFAPGGVSVPLALASAVALQERNEQRAATSARLHALIGTMRERLAREEGIDVQGDPDTRLPHVLTFSCLYADGQTLLDALDQEGFAVGSGSACTSGTLEPSRVLAAVGALTHGNVRLALHPGITEADTERFLAVLPAAIRRARERLGAAHLVNDGKQP